jgi:hypothetical protein
MKTTIVLGAMALALAGCVTPNAEQIGPFPNNYKQAVEAYVKESFFDPYSMRDVALSAPQTGHLYFQQGWVVCLQANAKNRMGGYTGMKRTALLINNGKVQQSMPDAPFCQGVSVTPWPEMEGR